jgi:hypothetical protein
MSEQMFLIGLQIIEIDRSKPFDPTEFIGGGVIEEQDERSLALTQLDVSKIRLETILDSNEQPVRSRKRLERLKESGQIRLDARFFKKFWENQDLIPEKWKETVDGSPRFIFFDGTVIRRDTRSFVLGLYWSCGKWNYTFYWLDGDGAGHSCIQSAVLELSLAA